MARQKNATCAKNRIAAQPLLLRGSAICHRRGNASRLFKKLWRRQYDTSHCGTSLLALPWSLKGFWAPLLDRAYNLKKWIVVSQLMILALIIVLAASLCGHVGQGMVLLLFALLGFVAATQDLAIDTYYLSNFDVAEQSSLMWARNTAFRVAYLLGAGILISLAGYISENHWIDASSIGGWPVVFMISGLLMAVALLFNISNVQNSASVGQSHASSRLISFGPALKSFFKISGVWRIIAYVLVFRLGDAFLSAIAQPFLLDSLSAGGLALKTSTVGFIYGTVGALSLIAGGILGGLAITRYGARKLLIPFSLLQSLSLLGYFCLAMAKPGLPIVCLVNSLEQLTFGLTTACYSVVLLTAVAPAYRATHFALICAVMNFGLILPGLVAGAISDRMGYAGFFMLTFVCSFCGPFVSKLLPEHAALMRPHTKAGSEIIDDVESSLMRF